MQPEESNLPNYIELLTLVVPTETKFFRELIINAIKAESRTPPNKRVIQIELFAGADRAIDIYGPYGTTKITHANDGETMPLAGVGVDSMYRTDAAAETNVVARVMYAL